MKYSILFFNCLFLFLPLSKLRATIIYVDSANVSGLQTGASWITAFSGFQEGINAANAGDSVWVAKGTYMSDSVNLYSFNMKEGVKILGGFLNTDTVYEQRDWENNVTTLKGTNNSVINNIDNELTNSALIDGFVITDGVHAYGGGMKNYNTSPTIRNCIFLNNKAYYGPFSIQGGALYNYNSSVVIENCTFLNNIALVGTTGEDNGGGAIFSYNSILTISNCNFLSNRASFYMVTTGAEGGGYGGAIYNYTTVATIVNCVFNDNYSGVDGGAIFNAFGSVADIDNCHFHADSSSNAGGALYNSGGSVTTVQNCEFTSNISSKGGAINNSGDIDIDSTLFMSNYILMYHGGAIHNSNFSSCNINNSNFTHNGVIGGGGGGGAIYNMNDAQEPLNINNCSFLSNFTNEGKGGGIYNYNASAVINNSLFSKNNSNLYANPYLSIAGDAVSNEENSHSKIVNCSFVQNGGALNPVTSGTICNIANSTSTIANTILWGNTTGVYSDGNSSAAITYSLIQGMPLDTINHNFDGSANPHFVDTASGLYQLLPLSVCINSGNNDSVITGTSTDIDGDIRIFDGQVEMGAYEYTAILPPIEDIGNDTAICQGSSIILTAPYAASSSYLWNTGDTSRNILVDSAGIYFVTISNALGEASDTMYLTVNPLPVVNLGDDTTAVNVDSLVLDAGNSGSAYLWSTGETTQSITVTTDGNYSVTVTNNAGCQAGDTIQVFFYPVNIRDVDLQQQWSVYPNPAQENIIIEAKGNVLKTEAVIMDIHGRTVLKTIITGNVNTIPLSGLKSGLYILKMGDGAVFKIEKL